MPENRPQLELGEAAQAATVPRPKLRVPRSFRSPLGVRGWWRTEREIPEGRASERAQRRDAAYRRSLAVADVVSASLAILVGISALGNDTLEPAALVAIPLLLVLSKVTGLYDRDENLLRKTTLDEVPTLFQVAVLNAFLIWLAGDHFVDGTFGRRQALGVCLLIFVGMFLGRAAARKLVTVRTTEERCLVIGDSPAAEWVAAKLDSATGLKGRVVGRVPLNGDGARANGIPVVGWLETLGQVLSDQQIDRAIIAPNGGSDDTILDAIREAKTLGVKVSVLPRLFEVVGSSVEFDEIDGMTLLGVRPHGLSRSSSAVKRAFDLAGAGLGIVLLSPLLAMIAIAIRLETPGPVFFRQRRMGRNDRPFEMLKFRTMVDGADGQKAALRGQNEAQGGLFKIADDPRITRVGKFLRGTSLDELPQLFNVVRGDMALVGPRPLIIEEDRKIEGWQRRRLLVSPGMTGLWQVFGSARIPLPEMVKIDYLYGANWSLWLDVKILLRTVPFVLGRRGL